MKVIHRTELSSQGYALDAYDEKACKETYVVLDKPEKAEWTYDSDWANFNVRLLGDNYGLLVPSIDIDFID